jgi:hypothetical protein
MRHLPFEDFEIHTKLTSDEVYYRFCDSVDTERKWWVFTKPFWGEVSRSEFKFWRAIWLNRFSPIISGKIWSEGSGCCVVIRMRMPWFGFVFYSLILGWLCVIYFGAIANLIVQKILTGVWQIDLPWVLLLIPGIFVFLHLVSQGIFKGEVRRVKDHLLWLSQTNKENIIYRDEFLGLTEHQIIRAWFVITLVISLVWVMSDLLR